jgi:hypothetical protein
MAKTATISKMYPTKAGGAAEIGDQGRHGGHEKVPNLAELLAGRERPVRARFVLPREQPEATYSLDAPDIMSIMQPGVPVDRAEAFADLAWRERLAQAARHRLRARQRGGAGSAAGPVSIQI